MPDESQDESQKTEEPTQKKLNDALKNGQVPNSREVTSFLILLVFTVSIFWLAPAMMKKSSSLLTNLISSSSEIEVNSVSLTEISIELLIQMLLTMAPFIIIMVIIIYFSALIQHPMILSAKSITPQLDRISPIKGIKRIFSTRSLVEFLKGIIKIIMVGIICYLSILPSIKEIIAIQTFEITSLLYLASKLISTMMIAICIFMGTIAFVDFLYQQFEHRKSLKMSLQDIKDEFKQTEGNPEVKAKLREIRAKRAQSRMMQELPKADVVVTNPTHYSVALKYDNLVSAAPTVVAKGMDNIALKIREVAKENDIPLFENAPLARALYSNVDLEEEIPIQYYEAVAEVIKYIYKLKNRK